MNGDVRDIIARALAVNHGYPEAVRTRLPQADDVLAALAAAGKAIVDVEEWEWGREASGDWTDVTEWGTGPEAQGNAETDWEENGGKVVRRHPAGQWEVVKR